MEKKIIDAVLAASRPTALGTTIAFNNHQGVPFSKEHFKPITKLAPNTTVAFIDGGNAEIIGGSQLSLQVIRVYYTIYSKLQKIEQQRYEWYALVTSEERNGKILYTTTFFGDAPISEITLDSSDKSIMQGIRKGSATSIGGIVRRFGELAVAGALAERLGDNALIVLDGSLDATYPGETLLLEKLCKHPYVVGISKTCDLHTNTGASILAALRSMMPAGSWAYHPLIISKNKDIAFTRLHENSSYIFRVDISDAKHLFACMSSLAAYASDPVFLGYPYGLIEADKFARVSNQELAGLKTRFMALAGSSWHHIQDTLRASDSHAVLDNIN